MKPSLSRIISLLGASMATLLTACGGGGSSADTPATAVSVPLATAMANLATSGVSGNFTISGWVSNSSTSVTGNGTYTISPAKAGTLNGAAALVQTGTISGTVTAGGQSSPISTSGTEYDNPATYANVASDIGGVYTVFPNYTYPATVKTGDSGPLYTGAQLYTNSSLGTKVGTENQSYAVAADSATTVLFTVTTDDYDTTGAHVSQSREVYRIDTSGGIRITQVVEVDYGVSAGSVPANLVFTFP